MVTRRTVHAFALAQTMAAQHTAGFAGIAAQAGWRCCSACYHAGLAVPVFNKRMV